MWPSVSIAFPCWRRGILLEKTLLSIQKQNYPGELEIIVVETEDDGYTKTVASAFGAIYINYPRIEPYPIFQSITEMWNTCLRNCTKEIVILQCAEVLHESQFVIQNLVSCISERERILATPLIKDLAEDGSFENWANHPREGSRPGWVSGAGPHAFRRKEILEIGGYEEMFYGYGHEDDYLFYVLRKNGWEIRYVEEAVCAHQWHPRMIFEPITGYANRALIRIFYTEIESGVRKPVMNAGPLILASDIGEENIAEWITMACSKLGMSDTFKVWAHCWNAGDRRPDEIFVAQRIIADEKLGLPSQVGEMITEAAWATIRAHEAGIAESNALRDNMPHWATRVHRCKEIQLTWASRAIGTASQLIESV